MDWQRAVPVASAVSLHPSPVFFLKGKKMSKLIMRNPQRSAEEQRTKTARIKRLQRIVVRYLESRMRIVSVAELQRLTRATKQEISLALGRSRFVRIFTCSGSSENVFTHAISTFAPIHAVSCPGAPKLDPLTPQQRSKLEARRAKQLAALCR